MLVREALSGCNFTNMTLVGSNDDTTFFDVTSKVNFRATAGTTYLIAVDGKNGATGTIELSWRQYERLFRLYLQTYNGTQSPLVPNSVTASNGSNTVTPLVVSLGVYEFNLPADGTTYIVTITGPTGIVWDPNNFPLDTSFRYLDELMRGDGTAGGQNSVSNAQNQTPRFINGYIRNITQPELTGLGVIIGSSRGPNPREETPCSPLGSQVIATVQYATYQCLSQPNTLHDIVPNMAGKIFTVSVLSFDVPVTTTYNGTPGSSFVATNTPTFNITGTVLGGGGTDVALTYTPTGNTEAITLRTTTPASGAFSFPNLAAKHVPTQSNKNGSGLYAARTGQSAGQPNDRHLARIFVHIHTWTVAKHPRRGRFEPNHGKHQPSNLRMAGRERRTLDHDQLRSHSRQRPGAFHRPAKHRRRTHRLDPNPGPSRPDPHPASHNKPNLRHHRRSRPDTGRESSQKRRRNNNRRRRSANNRDNQLLRRLQPRRHPTRPNLHRHRLVKTLPLRPANPGIHRKPDGR